jgi:hypothetical protein
MQPHKAHPFRLAARMTRAAPAAACQYARLMNARCHGRLRIKTIFNAQILTAQAVSRLQCTGQSGIVTSKMCNIMEDDIHEGRMPYLRRAA